MTTQNTVFGNNTNKLRKRIDNDRSAVYNYNSRGNVTKVTRTDGLTIECGYDKDDRANMQKTSLSGSETVTLNVTYEDGDAMTDDRAIESSFMSGNYGGYSADTYDKLGRLLSRSRSIGISGRPFGVSITDNVTAYASGKSNSTTAKPTQITHTLNYVDPNGEDSELLPTDTLGYDANGNITSVTRTNGSVRYKYDGLNRLKREDNQKLGKTWEYDYDAGGNITAKREYAYTTAEQLGTPSKTYGYTYNNICKDLLTSWNGQTIVYDDKWFPTRYKGASLFWEFGRLPELRHDNVHL